MKNPFNRDMRLFRFIFLLSGYEMMELFMSFVLILLGSAFLNPATDTFTNGHSYDIIKLVFNEAGFGAFLLFIGLVSYFALRDSGLKFRFASSLLQATTWTFLFASYFKANTHVAVPFMFLVFAVFSGVTAGRLLRDISNEIPPWKA